jgi:sugar phosphate isomerase/epimerase
MIVEAMTTDYSRRHLLGKLAGGIAALPLVSGEISKMEGHPMNMPIGLELYTVGKEMEEDPRGTLKQVASVGYKEVELSPMSKIGAKELRQMLDEVGLKNPAGHYMLPDLLKDLDGKMAFAKEMGQHYMVVTVPWIADVSRVKADPKAGQMGFFMALLSAFTLDDYKWSAEQFNKVGEQVKKAGLQLGYHNHNFEFKKFEGGVTGYDEFLRLTDADLVKLEMDCGWVTVAGHDPVEYLKKFPERYKLLHIKDFKKGFTPTHKLGEQGEGAPVPTELGRGGIDYSKIFAVLKKGQIDSIFVEQEPPFKEMPALEAMKVDYEYLHKLHV